MDFHAWPGPSSGHLSNEGSPGVARGLPGHLFPARSVISPVRETWLVQLCENALVENCTRIHASRQLDQEGSRRAALPFEVEAHENQSGVFIAPEDVRRI